MDKFSGAELVESWRNYKEDGDSPAGPLFVSSKFAEDDIASGCCTGITCQCGTGCSGSGNRQCC